MLVDREAAEERAELLPQLRLGHLAVSALGREDGDLPVLDSGGPQLLQDVGQDLGDGRAAGVVVDQDQDPVLGPGQLAEPRRTDRIGEPALQDGLLVPALAQRTRLEDAHQAPIRDLDRLDLLEVLVGEVNLHGSPPSPGAAGG